MCDYWEREREREREREEENADGSSSGFQAEEEYDCEVLKILVSKIELKE